MPHFADQLIAALQACGAPVCVGIDPQLERIPKHIRNAVGDDVESVRVFCGQLLEIIGTAGIRVVKPQVAYFEALGPAGMLLLQEVCWDAHAKGMLVIADAKRGDIGPTSEAYAKAWLGGSFQADSVTVNPFLGSDGVLPFVEVARAQGKGLFCLLRTSNPSSKELQELTIADGRPYFLHLAELISAWGADCVGESGYSLVGAVVGATQPHAAAELRALMPHTLFLIPGFGAQGATAADLKPFFREDGTGGLVNSSRGVIHAYGSSAFDGDWKASVHAAALQLIADVSSALR